jgi:integrase
MPYFWDPLHHAARDAPDLCLVAGRFDVHPRVAMRVLRHSKIAVTMEIYTEVPDQAAREALRRLGEQFDS